MVRKRVWKVASIVIAAFFSVPALADEAEDRFVASVRAAIKARQSQREKLEPELTVLEKQLHEMQVGLVDRRLTTRERVIEVDGQKRYLWNDPEAKENAVISVEQKLSVLRDVTGLIPALPLAAASEVRMIGRLPSYERSIVIVNRDGAESEEIYDTYYHYEMTVMDENTLLVRWKATVSLANDDQLLATSSGSFWKLGSTEGAPDGPFRRQFFVCRVVGVQHQVTAEGASEVVPVLEPVIYDDLIRKAKQAE